MEAVIDGNYVTINENGESLCSGTHEKRRPWLDESLSSGTPVEKPYLDSGSSMSILNIILPFRCDDYNMGKACVQCALFANPPEKTLPLNITPGRTTDHVEMAISAIRSGWRGMLSITGGARPPALPGKDFEELELVMNQLRGSVDEKNLSELHIVPKIYPPEDLAEMHKWKDLGVNGAEFDLEVMDPAYLKAICPGKQNAFSIDHWKEAQVAAAEIFGRGRGAIQNLVTGLEPLSLLVDGIEERMSNGIYSSPLIMAPTPGSAFASSSVSDAKWHVDANEKIADSYFKYADTFDVNLLNDNRPGFTRTGLSHPLNIVRDEMMRRLQAHGKYPAGLPSQDFIETGT